MDENEELLQQINIGKVIIENDFANFFAQVFTTTNPGKKLIGNWHIDLLAEVLTEAEKGNIKRLIINMPPRYLKSLMVSVAWPAWLLGKSPNRRIMAASYSQQLSLKHSHDCRLVLSSPWFQTIFPGLQLKKGQNEKNKYVTTQRGYRFATSVGGTATGEGGNYLIIDDPHNPAQAASPVKRKKAIDWFEQTFVTRLDDKNDGVIILVMQRLHEDDLTGHLLRSNQSWHHLNLPALNDKRSIYVVGKRKFIWPENCSLHSGRENIDQLMETRKELGDYNFRAQYMQQPVAVYGNMVQRSWFKRYRKLPTNLSKIYQSWDTAIKGQTSNDYSVGTIWAEIDNNYYLIDVVRIRAEYPELKKKLIAKAIEWPSLAILIEDKASGQSLIQDLRRETKHSIIAIKPKNDKLSRFASVTPLFEAGKVILPEISPWLVEYEAELLAFPGTQFDDQVDSTSQFLNYIKQKENLKLNIKIIDY